MNSDKNNALVAKARAIYGRRIKEAEYHVIMNKSSVAQVISALKDTDRYKNELDSVNENQAHRGQIELILEKSVFDVYERLNRFIPSQRNNFNEFYAYKKELGILLDTIMFINLGQYDSVVAYLPMYAKDYLSFDIENLIRARSFDDLKKILAGTRYGKTLGAALPGSDYRAGEDLDFEELAVTMYTEYYRWLLNRVDSDFSGAVRNVLRGEVLRQITLDNLLMIYRMRRYFSRPPETVKRLVFPIKTNLSDDEINAFVSDGNSTAEITEFMENRIFGGKTSVDEEFIELSVERDVCRRYGSKLRISDSGAVVLFSLIQLLEVEKNNITTVIEGIKYGLSPAEISKLIAL